MVLPKKIHLCIQQQETRQRNKGYKGRQDCLSSVVGAPLIRTHHLPFPRLPQHTRFLRNAKGFLTFREY